MSNLREWLIACFQGFETILGGHKFQANLEKGVMRAEQARHSNTTDQCT